MNTHTHHHHAHSHPPVAISNRSLAIAVTLNLAFALVEAAFGVQANSLALLADAGHNFSDVVSLLLAWGAVLAAKRIPSERFTYGLRSSTILAALANSMLLMIAVGGVSLEAIQRLAHPAPVVETTMIWVAAAGVVVNLVAASLLMRGHRHDINLRGAFLHMLADAAVSLGVIVAGAAMLWTGWLWLDPAISMAIAVVIFAGTWSLLNASLRLSLHAVPASIDLNEVTAFLHGLPWVREVHDLHIWGMSTTEIALTVHLVARAGHPGDAALSQLSMELEQRFNISHSTVQIELGEQGVFCRLAPEDVV